MRYERMLSAPSPKRRRKRRKKQLLSTQTALTTAGEKQANENLVTLGGFSGRLGTAVK